MLNQTALKVSLWNIKYNGAFKIKLVIHKSQCFKHIDNKIIISIFKYRILALSMLLDLVHIKDVKRSF